MAGIAIVIAIFAVVFSAAHQAAAPVGDQSLGASLTPASRVTTGYNAISFADPSNQIFFNNNTALSYQRAVATATTTAGIGFATSTPCAIQSPAATSTIINVSFQANLLGTSTVAQMSIGTSTTNSAFATSSSIFVSSPTLGNQPSITFDPTTNNGILGPNTWVVWGIQGGGLLTGFQINGTCTLATQTLN